MTLLDLPLTGWHNQRVAAVSDASLAFGVYQPRYLELSGAALLLISFGLSNWFLRSRPLWSFAITSLCALVLLVCPITLVPMIRGLFLGTAMSLALEIVRRTPPPSFPALNRDSAVTHGVRIDSPAVTGAVVVLVVLIAVVASAAISAAEIDELPVPLQSRGGQSEQPNAAELPVKPIPSEQPASVPSIANRAGTQKTVRIRSLKLWTTVANPQEAMCICRVPFMKRSC